jgi:hypothetical protein
LPISDFQLPIESTQLAIGNQQIGNRLSGGVAQLAEHMVCNHGVRGSNPLTSTKALPIFDCRFAI